jgi:hypothetical protein
MYIMKANRLLNEEHREVKVVVIIVMMKEGIRRVEQKIN